MQSYQKKSSPIYDYVVIGSGLTGLCVATALSKISERVLVLESSDTFGGFNRSIETPFGKVNNGLRFLPDTDLSQKAISFLEMLMMTSLSPESQDLPPLTFESGELKNFLGFGDHPPAFYDELSYFTHHRQLKTRLQPHEWTEILNSQLTCEVMTKSYVTKLTQENSQVTSVVVNGSKNIQAHNFIYCGPMKALKNILPEGTLSSRAQSKMNKNQYWTALCLDLMHSSIQTEKVDQIHLLDGTTQDDLGPSIGYFLPSENMVNEHIQYSQWMTFIDDEAALDSEAIATALKKMKRQIKRAYPQSLDQLKFERILVVPSYSGNGDLKLTGNQTLPQLNNFWIASAQAHQQKNILGSLMQAELVTSALGCHPLGHQVQVSNSNDELSHNEHLQI